MHNREGTEDPSWLDEYINDDDSSRPQKPLKRGDACLACRKRRIRCGAEKPACATCVRLHKQCVYDTTQRPSRISRLKDRIAQLEGQVNRLKDPDESAPTPLPETFPSSFTFSAPLSSVSSFTSVPGLGAGATLDVNSGGASHGAGLPAGPFEARDMLSLVDLGFPITPVGATLDSGSFGGIQQQQHQQHHQHHQHHQQQHHAANGLPGPSHHPNQDDLFNNPPGSLSSLPPSSTSHPPPYPQSTNPRPLQPPNEGFNYDFGLLDTTMVDLATTLSGTVGFDNLFGPTPPAPTPMSSHPTLAQQRPSTSSGGFHSSLDNNVSSSGTTPSYGDAERRRSASTGAPATGFTPEIGSDAMMEISSYGTFTSEGHTISGPAHSRMYGSADEEAGDRGLLGGWFDPDDIPPSVRDHLLDLYFSKSCTSNVFQNLINVPRFYTRLTLPPSKRPHPCLLYMMYLEGARLSSQPGLRALEQTFYEIAQRKIQQGLKDADRLLDVVRAMSLLTSYLFNKEMFEPGISAAGSVVRLAVACGLHRIPSGVFAPPPKLNMIGLMTMRPRSYVLAPPEDVTDLAERIHAFWAVYEIDQCTSIAYLWDPGFRIEHITTPLPRPFGDYASGFVSTADDIRLTDVLEPVGNAHHSRQTDFHALRLKALTLLAAAGRLRDLPPETNEGRSSALVLSDPRSVMTYGGTSRAAFESAPNAFNKLKSALDRFCDELPRHYAAPWPRWDEDSDEHFPPRFQLRKDTAVLWFIIGYAYSALWNVRSLSSENTKSVLAARRLANIIGMYTGEEIIGGYDTFVICIWFWDAVVLLREWKRLDVIGRTEEARKIEADMDIILNVLTEWQTLQAQHPSNRINVAILNNQVLEQCRKMSNEEWAAAMAEVDGAGA